MRKSSHNAVRDALHKHPDGLTVFELHYRFNIHQSTIKRALEQMPDAYIDRWEAYKGRGQLPWRAVWCVVVPPKNCPMPSKA